MSIKKLTLLMGLSVFLVGCSTGYNGDYMQSLHETNTQKGARYLLGRGVQQDNRQAFSYFSKGAEEGDAHAQNEIAYMYAAGKGTTQDRAKALFWYKRAAEHGLPSAQCNLGLMYLHGLGTAPNRTLALKWLQKSADQGFEPARVKLAQLRSS